ncbi:MAG: J domain-containing protein [Chloroflexi bacterium]|nr:J domain-containing protein [Chloroflexota bacterium]
MAKRDPRDILGVGHGASPMQIKAAWRRLARANHPDLTGDDPAASRLATRRMAEINDAYAALTRDADGGGTAASTGSEDTPFEPGVVRRQGGPPPPKPQRPVTGRVDMSGVYQPRNQAVGNGAGRTPLPGQPPKATTVVGHEPPRASTPTGPTVRGRLRHFRPAPAPSLPDAEATVIPFGKFHDHTLGQIAAFEPSYIDWVAGTVNHDPDLVSAARVIQADLDRRGVARRSHPAADRRGRTA